MRVKKLGACAVGMNYRAVTPELIQAFHEQGILLSAWTLQEKADMERLIGWGADFITSDRIWCGSAGKWDKERMNKGRMPSAGAE